MDILLIGENGTSYTIANGTRAITLVGLPAITSKNLLYIYNITQDKLYFSPTETLPNATVAGGNIINVAVSFPVLASTDELHMQITLGEMAYDATLDANKSLVQNPEWAHYTSVEHIIDETDVAIDTYFHEFYVTTYRNLAIQIHSVDATGFEWKIYRTLDDAATLPATGGTAGLTWIEVTTELFGGAKTGTAIDDDGYVDSSKMPYKYLIEYTNQNATNTVDCWIRKY